MKTFNRPVGELIEVMPSAGFRALFVSTESGLPFAVVLVGWALVEHEGGLREVEGLIAGNAIQSAATRTNFLRYIGPSERVEDYAAEAKVALKHLREETSNGGRT